MAADVELAWHRKGFKRKDRSGPLDQRSDGYDLSGFFFLAEVAVKARAWRRLIGELAGA